MKSLLLRFGSVLALGSAGPLFGAPLQAGGTALAIPPPPVVIRSLTAVDLQSAVSLSKALFKKGDFPGGEDALFSVNRHPDGTPVGNRDSGAALLRVACVFLQEGDAATATRLGQLALDKFNQARVALAGSPNLSADVYTRMGFIEERIVGDRSAAQADYQAAARFYPSKPSLAAAAVNRLQTENALNSQRAAKLSGNLTP